MNAKHLWWALGFVALALVAYFLFRSSDRPARMSERPERSEGFVGGIVSAIRSVSSVVSSGFKTSNSHAGADDGATTTMQPRAIDYGGGDLTGDDLRAAEDLLEGESFT